MKRTDIKRRPLADTVLASLEPEAKEYRELDGSGLYFRVKPDGGKSWQLRYKKHTTGKWGWIGIGSYPEISGTFARAKAAEQRKIISAGLDPLEQKRSAKAEQEALNTAAAYAQARQFCVVAEHWLKAKEANGRAASTINKIRTYLDKDILPALGEKQLDGITREDCAKLQATLESRAAFNVAKKARGWINEIFGFAIAKGLTENDPASRLVRLARKAPPAKPHPHLFESELPDFLRALQTSTSRLPARTAAWLCLWTATRPGMVRLAEWTEIDLEAATWTIPAAKMKMRRDYVSPLPTQAVEALKDVHRVTGASRWVFPGIGTKNPTISEVAINKVFALVGYKGRMVGHGSRHTFSTLMHEHGFNKDHIEAQLSHKEKGIAGHYNFAGYLVQRREMMQWYADHLDKLAQGNVIDIKRA